MIVFSDPIADKDGFLEMDEMRDMLRDSHIAVYGKPPSKDDISKYSFHSLFLQKFIFCEFPQFSIFFISWERAFHTVDRDGDARLSPEEFEEIVVTFPKIFEYFQIPKHIRSKRKTGIHYWKEKVFRHRKSDFSIYSSSFDVHMMSDESPRVPHVVVKEESETEDRKLKPGMGLVDHIRKIGDREKKRKNRVASYLASGSRGDLAPILANEAKRPQSERPPLNQSVDFQSFHMITDPSRDPHECREALHGMKESHAKKGRSDVGGEREEGEGEEREPLIEKTKVRERKRMCECDCECRLC